MRLLFLHHCERVRASALCLESTMSHAGGLVSLKGSRNVLISFTAFRESWYIIPIQCMAHTYRVRANSY